MKYASNRFKTPRILISSKSLGYSKIAEIDDTKIVIDDVPMGVHDLTVRLLNKDDQDTVLNDKGEIIDDLYAVIESLQVDHYDISHKLNCVSTYHDNHGNEIQTNGWLSFSQDYQIWVQVPGWYFLRNLSILPEDQAKLYFFESYHSKVTT